MWVKHFWQWSQWWNVKWEGMGGYIILFNLHFIGTTEILYLQSLQTWVMNAMGAGLAQWWEHLSPTNVAWVWFWPSTICGLSLLLVLSLLWVFFAGFSSFPPSAKTNISEFQSDKDRLLGWKPSNKPDMASKIL